MKKILTITLSLLLVLGLNAQQKQASISWTKTTHDFSKFKEERGKQNARFTFTNTGNEPLIITNVKASCGCTTSNYTKEPVKPGETGFVDATYNPKNRPGKFNKSITVTTNASQPTHVLRIMGDVIPREKGITDYYPKTFETVRLKTTHLAFVKVKNTETKIDSIPVVNMGTTDATITFTRVPKHLSIEMVPATLKGMSQGAKHGQKGYIKVTYNGSLKGDYGFLMDRIQLVLNGNQEKKKRISISATIEEDFSHLSEAEKANAPSVIFNEKEFNFGTLKQGEKVTQDYTFKNTGKSDLIIRKIKTTCGCTATNPEKMVIKPGETSKIAVTFNSAGKRGRQNKSITVITNSPHTPSTVLKIKGEVLVDQK